MKLDAGLLTLNFVDYIIASVVLETVDENIANHVREGLTFQNSSWEEVADVLEGYVKYLGEGHAEYQKIQSTYQEFRSFISG